MSMNPWELCPVFYKDSTNSLNNIFLEKEFFQFSYFSEPEDVSLWAVKFSNPQGVHMAFPDTNFETLVKVTKLVSPKRQGWNC